MLGGWYRADAPAPASRSLAVSFVITLAGCHQLGAHRPRGRPGRREQQTHEPLHVDDQAYQKLLEQHPRAAPVARVPGVVAGEKPRQLAFDGRMLPTHLL